MKYADEWYHRWWKKRTYLYYTLNGLRMRREYRERFPCHRLQRKPLASDPGMHHGTCVTHVPWCMSGSLNHGGVENVPAISGACKTRIFTYLAKGPYHGHWEPGDTISQGINIHVICPVLPEYSGFSYRGVNWIPLAESCIKTKH